MTEEEIDKEIEEWEKEEEGRAEEYVEEACRFVGYD